MKKVKDLTAEEKHSKILSMWTRYKKYAYTNNYIIGCFFDKKVYYLCCKEDIFEKFFDQMELSDGSTKNPGYILKVRIMGKFAKYIVENGKYLCEENELVNILNLKNNGKKFEKMIHDLYGLQWYNDNNKFNECGDIIVNNISYQIKFTRPMLVREGTLDNIETNL